jgi:hypothetical protein
MMTEDLFGYAGGAVLLALCGGCGGRTTDGELSQLSAAGDGVTALDFTRTVLVANPPPPLQVTVTDPSEVRALYRETLTLPELTAPKPACPSDVAVRYHLTFRSGASVVMQADEEPDGCQRVVIAGVSNALVAGNAYWARLSKGLGVPESVMYPNGL